MKQEAAAGPETPLPCRGVRATGGASTDAEAKRGLFLWREGKIVTKYVTFSLDLEQNEDPKRRKKRGRESRGEGRHDEGREALKAGRGLQRAARDTEAERGVQGRRAGTVRTLGLRLFPQCDLTRERRLQSVAWISGKGTKTPLASASGSSRRGNKSTVKGRV